MMLWGGFLKTKKICEKILNFSFVGRRIFGNLVKYYKLEDLSKGFGYFLGYRIPKRR